MRKLYFTIPLLALAAGGGWWYMNSPSGPPARFRTTVVERGPFLATITATGTLQPIDAIDVGAQVAGRIERFGLDPRCLAAREKLAIADAFPPGLPHLLLGAFCPTKVIDFNSPVERGTLLAQIDPRPYEVLLERAKADLERAEADVKQVEAKLIRVESDWRRAQDLYPRNAIAQAEYVQARAAFEEATALVAVKRSDVSRSRAELKNAEINLGYTTIHSPVRGMIIDRRVNIGQTVVSSLNAPSLFLIATDLRKLQVYAAINEADIGHVGPGQEVRFSVDASKREFVGRVAEDQPRLNASMTQNVVTYTVVVDVDNANMELKPYQTANMRFVVAQKSSAMVIPNGALRWRPQPQHVAPELRDAYLKHSRQRRTPREAEKESSERSVFVLEGNGYVRPVRVSIGLSDGTVSEVTGGDLREGDQIVEGEDRHDANGHSNPFISNVYGAKKQP